MGLAIIFRNALCPNLFNKILIHSIKIIGMSSDNQFVNNLLLCSGYIQEISNGYRATNEIDFCDNINSFVKNYIVLGVHSNLWKSKYRLFCNELYLRTQNCISRKFLITSGTKWHAKVFTLTDDHNKCLAIIGSSNLTSRAFGSSCQRYVRDFNYECDTVMWSDSACWSRNMDEFILAQGEDYRNSIIFSNDYNTFGFNIDERIQELNRTILGQRYLSGTFNSYIKELDH